MEGDALVTTVSYLMLPDSRDRSECWNHETDRRYGLPDQGESGYGIPVTNAERPSERSLRRFSRALRILDLEVFVHRSQQGVSLGVPRPRKTLEGSGRKRRPYAAGQWPQLTLLARSVVHEDD